MAKTDYLFKALPKFILKTIHQSLICDKLQFEAPSTAEIVAMTTVSVKMKRLDTIFWKDGHNQSKPDYTLH